MQDEGAESGEEGCRVRLVCAERRESVSEGGCWWSHVRQGAVVGVGALVGCVHATSGKEEKGVAFEGIGVWCERLWIVNVQCLL